MDCEASGYALAFLFGAIQELGYRWLTAALKLKDDVSVCLPLGKCIPKAALVGDSRANEAAQNWASGRNFRATREAHHKTQHVARGHFCGYLCKLYRPVHFFDVASVTFEGYDKFVSHFNGFRFQHLKLTCRIAPASPAASKNTQFVWPSNASPREPYSTTAAGRRPFPRTLCDDRNQNIL